MKSKTVDTDLVVAGYEVSGSVVSSDDLPMIGVELYLYSNTKSKIPFCEQPTQKGPVADKEALCISRSNEKGHFVFTSIPSGEYSVVPYYKGFRVAPSELKVTVEHGSVEVSQSFKVKGFSIKGTVVDNSKSGISGAVVYVNGKKTTVTNEKGEYTLDEMSSGKYTIEVEKERMLFKGHKDLQVIFFYIYF